MTLSNSDSAATSADNAWDESDQGSQYQDDIDDLIESTRKGVRERANVEHYAHADETGKENLWRHRKESGRSNYGLAANKPSTAAAGMQDGALYYETDTGLLKKYNYTDEAWTTVGTPNHSAAVTTYTTGTIDVTNASATVAGNSTAWSGNIAANDILLGPDSEYYVISSVDSNTQITLDRVYDGTTASGQSYTVYLDGHPAYLPKGGGTVDGTLTLAGSLAMGSSKITGLAAATENGDAVRYEQVIGVFAKVATGTYTGDATASHAITGLSWQPKKVTVYAQYQGHLPVVKTNQDGLYAKDAAGNWLTTFIISLDAAGFTVGNHAYVNGSGVTYTYIAETW